MTQALAQARKALENVLPTLDDLAKYRGLSYSEAQSLAVDVRSALAAIDAALEGGAVPKVPEGYALVPVEPTDAMLLAAFYAANDHLINGVSNSHCRTAEERSAHAIKPIYRAMLSALDLPSPPTGA